MKASLRTYMLSQIDIAGLVGVRIYSPPAPRDTPTPYITLSVINSKTERHIVSLNDVVDTVMQIDCWGATSASVSALASAVRNAVDGYHGEMREKTVFSIILDNEIETREELNDGSQQLAHRKAQTYRIRHSQ
jgi:hypothetical protein